jgi:hypothetical protein
MLASRGVSQERSEYAKASKLRWKSYTRTTEAQPAAPVSTLMQQPILLSYQHSIKQYRHRHFVPDTGLWQRGTYMLGTGALGKQV